MKALLISPDKVKKETPLDLNVSGEYLVTAIKTAQEIQLVEVIGTRLYDKLQSLVANNAVTEPYKTLLDDYVANFLEWAVVADIIPVVSYKQTNAGVVTTDDEHIKNVEYAAIKLLQDDAIFKRDVYKKRMQEWLCKNYSAFEEFKSCSCAEVKEQLYSSSTCPLWLGGRRGVK